MFDQFNYEQYNRLLDLVTNDRKNLTFSDFRHPDTPPRFFVLRHDVDLSLSAALRMARIESERGVRATYFLLVSSDHYNLLSEQSCPIPRQLAALGHEVGLHYDMRAMSQRHNQNLNTQLQYEIDILAELTGTAIHSIAMHNPSVDGDDPFAGDNRFINAYDSRFTKAIAYFSDSAGAWRDNAYEAFVRSSIPDQVQLLIHPFFWANASGDRWERLNNWAGDRRRALHKHEETFRTWWSNHSGVHEHERRIQRIRE